MASLSSFDSDFASEISSLSGDSGKIVDFYASFSEHGLHGRTQETKIIEESYKRIQNGQAAEVILIRGDFGCGKSFLVEAMRSWVTESNGYFIAGHFDQSENSAPFSALTEALSDLCDLINQEQSLRNEVAENSDDTQLLKSASSKEAKAYDVQLQQCKFVKKVGLQQISCLSGLVNNFAAIAGLQDTNSIDFKQGTASFKESFMTLLRAVTDGDERQIFLFLDDLQYADDKSLEVIASIVRETELKNVLLVCSYREISTPDNRVIPIFGSKEDMPKLTITDVALRGLDVESIKTLLSEMLKKEESIVMGLSEVVLAKTDGNVCIHIYYLLSFMCTCLLTIALLSLISSKSI